MFVWFLITARKERQQLLPTPPSPCPSVMSGTNFIIIYSPLFLENKDWALHIWPVTENINVPRKPALIKLRA